MFTDSFIAPTPQEAYKLAIQKYGSIDNFKLINASQYKNEEGKLVAKITIEVEEEIYLKSSQIDEEEALLEEINILKSKMDRMKEVLQKPLIKSAVDDVKKILVNRGLSKKWIEHMLDPFIGTQVGEDKSLLLSFVLEEIEEALNISKKVLNKRINILVGATGVGKTTTIAKMAGWSVLKGVNPAKIAFINLDTFKPGAYEQLQFYATNLGIDYFAPQNLEDFIEIIQNLYDKDLIFIDTTGISPYDVSNLMEMVKYLKSIENLDDISSSLVVSVATKYRDLKSIYEHFSFLNIDNLIATKFDETNNVGNLIAFLLDTNLPISFLSTGQEVPIDFEIATKRRLIEAFRGEIE